MTSERVNSLEILTNSYECIPLKFNSAVEGPPFNKRSYFYRHLHKVFKSDRTHKLVRRNDYQTFFKRDIPTQSGGSPSFP